MTEKTACKNNFAFRQQNNTLKLYFYDDIKPNSYSWWTDEVVVSETSSKYVSNLLDKNQSATRIEVCINSNGGDVKEGIGIYSALQRHQAEKICYVDGFAASIASVIAMACDKIIMSPLSLMFLHHAEMGAWGNAEQLRKAADDVETIDGCSTKAYQLHAGDKLSDEKLKELLDKQTWVTAEDCLELGLCDEIENKTQNDTKTVAQKFIATYQQKILNQMEQDKKTVIQQMAEKFKQSKEN